MQTHTKIILGALATICFSLNFIQARGATGDISGKLNYSNLGFVRGNYRTVEGPNHCIQGEYRLIRDGETGRVYLRAEGQVLVNHIDQMIVNKTDRSCTLNFTNSINSNNELESIEVQSCEAPINVSHLRTFKIKFGPEAIDYVFITKDNIKKTSKKTKCKLERMASK